MNVKCRCCAALLIRYTVGEQKRGDIKEYNFNIIILSIVFYDIEFPLLALLSRIIYTYAYILCIRSLIYVNVNV